MNELDIYHFLELLFRDDDMVVLEVVPMSETRGKCCYICGEEFRTWGTISEVILDRKPRKVHNDCKTNREKAMRDFAAFSGDVEHRQLKVK